MCGVRPANPLLAIFSIPQDVLLIHLTRSLSANADLNSVKKMALLARADGLSPEISGFAIHLRARPPRGGPCGLDPGASRMHLDRNLVPMTYTSKRRTRLAMSSY